MKIVAPHDFQHFVEEHLIDKTPIVFQSIKGLTRTAEDLNKLKELPENGQVTQYRSDLMKFYPFYKKISKIHVK